MEALSSLLMVALVSLLSAISPGPAFLVVVKNSLSYSRKIGFLTALGASLALLIHLSYTIIGIGELITESSMLYLLMKYAGAGYLFYIGFKSFLASFKKHEALNVSYTGSATPLSSAAALKQGFLTNLLNPMCALFFVSLFSQFVLVSTPLSLIMGYACINCSISLGWLLFLSYLITSKWIASRMNRFRVYINRAMGCILMLFSVKLLIL